MHEAGKSGVLNVPYRNIPSYHTESHNESGNSVLCNHVYSVLIDIYDIRHSATQSRTEQRSVLLLYYF
jgi:hypothetical protein